MVPVTGSGSRNALLELAVLGSLHETPLHGYELRKRLNTLLGMFRAFSYGSLYPCLRGLLNDGLIAEEEPREDTVLSRRSKIVYKLTAEGKERLHELLTQAGPSAWEDESFGIHFAFFRHAEAEVRLRILEGRRSRLEERLERVRTALARTRERLDRYTLELQRHGLESVEREVRWLNELIDSERRSSTALPSAESTGPAAPAGPTETGETASGAAAPERAVQERDQRADSPEADE